MIDPMGIDDPLLPAAVHLTGEFADDVIRPAIAHAGGTLAGYRCTGVHYRPAHDLIARFRVDIDWGDGERRRETIYVGTTRRGAHPGTIPVSASSDGADLAAGVWRWPFDPLLPALEPVVRAPSELLVRHGVISAASTASSPSISTSVAAYRPTQRAVLRLRGHDTTWFAKVVRPSETEAIIRRHEVLREHGLPVPEIVASESEIGLVVLAELSGATLRDLVKADAPAWPPPRTLADIVRRLQTVSADDLTSMRSRLSDGPHHTALLASVLPAERDRLARLDDRLRLALDTMSERDSLFVHGDLHERQLIVDGGEIVGLLDIDECGRGDPLDDVAVPVAHLRYRALTAANSRRIHRYADELIAELAASIDPADAAIGSAAVLAGLATSPFRAQTDGWEQRVVDVLDLVDEVLA